MKCETNTDQMVMTPENKAGKGLRNTFEWIETIVLTFGIVCIILTFVVRQIIVDGISMLPNYKDGERVLLTGQAGNLGIGDVVVIVNTHEKTVIKRVVATAGQTVDFDEEKGCVLIDGVALDDSQYGIENGITYTYQMAGYEQLTYPAVVPEGHVYVLGDNREHSADSRAFGMVDERNILGKVLWILLPVSEFGEAK